MEIRTYRRICDMSTSSAETTMGEQRLVGCEGFLTGIDPKPPFEDFQQVEQRSTCRQRCTTLECLSVDVE